MVYQTFKREVFLQSRPTRRPRLVHFFFLSCKPLTQLESKQTDADLFHILTRQQIYVISVASIPPRASPLKETNSFLICATFNQLRESGRKQPPPLNGTSRKLLLLRGLVLALSKRRTQSVKHTVDVRCYETPDFEKTAVAGRARGNYVDRKWPVSRRVK